MESLALNPPPKKKKSTDSTQTFLRYVQFFTFPFIPCFRRYIVAALYILLNHKFSANIHGTRIRILKTSVAELAGAARSCSFLLEPEPKKNHDYGSSSGSGNYPKEHFHNQQIFQNMITNSGFF